MKKKEVSLPREVDACVSRQRLSRLAIGTVQFGLSYGIANQVGQVTRPEAKAMLQLSALNSINMLDTAIAYGESEKCLGEIGTQGFKLVTKLPALPDGCADVSGWVQQQVADSLTRLGVAGVYGLLLHQSDQLLGPNGNKLYHALQELKDMGQYQKVGVSIYNPIELEEICKVFRLDLVQAPFNLVDRRLHQTGWLQRLKDDGVEIHARSVFLQGLLLMPQASMPHKFSQWDALWKRWHNWLLDHDVFAVEACLAFPLAYPEIDRVIVGSDSLNQLAQIIAAAKFVPHVDLPDLHCEEENLINPARWSKI